jgi:hypothetical protein
LCGADKAARRTTDMPTDTGTLSILVFLLLAAAVFFFGLAVWLHSQTEHGRKHYADLDKIYRKKFGLPDDDDTRKL